MIRPHPRLPRLPRASRGDPRGHSSTSAKSFGIRTCRQTPRFARFWPKSPACNSFRMRTCRLRPCNPFRLRTCEKTRGRGLRRIRPLADSKLFTQTLIPRPSAVAGSVHRSPITGHGSIISFFLSRQYASLFPVKNSPAWRLARPSAAHVLSRNSPVGTDLGWDSLRGADHGRSSAPRSQASRFDSRLGKFTVTR